MEEQTPKPGNHPTEAPMPEQTPEPVVPTQTNAKPSKRQWIWCVVVLLVVAAGVCAFLFFRHRQATPKANTSKTESTLNIASRPQATTVSLVHALYTSTTPSHTQDSNDGPVLTAAGHYLELNGNGVLVFDGKVVAQNPAADGSGPVPQHQASIPGAATGSNAGMKISDAVLSKNGLHYGFLLTPVNGTDTSDLYIDSKEVGPLSSAGLIAVSNDGKSYLDDRELSKVTPTTYNTGIHEEAIELNGSQTVVTSGYGFLGEDYSGDLKNVLALSRNYGPGSTYYFNNQKLSNCSYTWSGNDPNAPEFHAQLSQDGTHTLCDVYHLESAPSGSGLVYQMSDLQVFEDDKSVLDITKPILADQVIAVGYSTVGQWMLLLARGNVVTPSGSSSVSELFNGLSTADLSAATSNQIQLTYANSSKYALYLPDTHKLLTKGLTLTKSPDLTTATVSSIEYSSASNTLYIYDSK